MLKSTIDLEVKGVDWMNCLIDVAKKKITPGSERAKECDNNGILYNSSATERGVENKEYNRKMSK